MGDKLINFIRWLLFVPGAFLCYRIVSVFVKAFPEILERMDLGIVAISIFFANLVNSCICGASFAVSGLWIAPKKNTVVLAVLSTIFGIFSLFMTWLLWYETDGFWKCFSLITFNIFAVFSSIIGGLMYIEQSDNK